MKEISSKSKCIAWKVDCYRTGKYTVCRRVRASFSPEILQVGAVKGLIITEIHAKREAWKEEALARRSSLKGRERVIVSQMDVGTVSTATLGKLPRDGVERIKLLTFSSA